MTIEEVFFKTFGIEPKRTQQIVGDGVFSNVIEDEYYPKITAEKLLELICILDNFTVQNYLKKQPFDIFELKQSVLRRCLYLDNIGINKDELRQQIRKLFEE